MPARLPSFALPELPQAAFSAHIVQPQRMSNRMQTMFPSEFHRSLPQRLRQLRPMRPGAAKVIKTGVAAAQSDQEWALCFCCSIPADLGN